jgi:hypothetical protein
MAGTTEFAIMAARPGWKGCTRAWVSCSSPEGSASSSIRAGAFYELPVDSLTTITGLMQSNLQTRTSRGEDGGSMEPSPLAVRRPNKFPQALSHRLEYRDGKSRISLESVLEVSPG